VCLANKHEQHSYESEVFGRMSQTSLSCLPDSDADAAKVVVHASRRPGQIPVAASVRLQRDIEKNTGTCVPLDEKVRVQQTKQQTHKLKDEAVSSVDEIN
jgi:hypothetical protein